MDDPAVIHLAPLDNLRTAYHILNDRVITALRTQLGDAARLGQVRSQALSLLQSAQPHQHAFPPEEYATLERSIATMVEQLDAACHSSNDLPPTTQIVVSTRVSNGRRGRPRVEINPSFLAEALSLRGPTGIAPVAQCSARTVRRRALEQGLVQPCPPVIHTITEADGTVVRIHTSSTRAVTVITDAELDELVSSTLQIFPRFGRTMLAGYLKACDYHIPMQRIVESYLRVHGPPAAFGRRAIQRKVYHVAGANSLWHHDGQHGLIRYKMVQHGFIDGKSHLITSLRVRNNNRAMTVLVSFLEGVATHGWPSRCRGDHGTENVQVARVMEETMGPGRGSYIWGRSVHNTRIERLWYDVTHGYGQKWKNFFFDLEVHCGLNPQLSAHIWLLHYLFLDAVDRDAQDFVQAWNSHKMRIRGQRTASPREMFLFSLIQDGPRGIQHMLPRDEEIEDIATYGVDWQVAEEPRYMDHFFANDPHRDEHDTLDNPFQIGPARLSHVPCEEPNCPLTPEQVDYLGQELPARVDLSSRSMSVRRIAWIQAMDICSTLFNP